MTDDMLRRLVDRAVDKLGSDLAVVRKAGSTKLASHRTSLQAFRTEVRPLAKELRPLLLMWVIQEYRDEIVAELMPGLVAMVTYPSIDEQKNVVLVIHELQIVRAKEGPSSLYNLVSPQDIYAYILKHPLPKPPRWRPQAAI